MKQVVSCFRSTHDEQTFIHSNFVWHGHLCRCSSSLTFWVHTIIYMGVTSGARTADPSGTPSESPVFSGIRVPRSLVSCVVFCRSLLVLFVIFFVIVLSVLLRSTDSDYPLGIFQLFLKENT